MRPVSVRISILSGRWMPLRVCFLSSSLRIRTRLPTGSTTSMAGGGLRGEDEMRGRSGGRGRYAAGAVTERRRDGETERRRDEETKRRRDEETKRRRDEETKRDGSVGSEPGAGCGSV